MLADDHPAAFYLSLRCPLPYTIIGFTPDDASTGPQTWGHGADGPTFALTSNGDHPRVATEGPLWTTIETAYREWLDLGKPSRDRFGITADNTRQWVWIDDPSHRIAGQDSQPRV